MKQQQQERIEKEGDNEKQPMPVESLELEGRTEGPYQAFLFAMNSPVTRERYSTRLRGFFNFIGINGSSMEERCRNFVEKASRIDDANVAEGQNNNGRGYDGQAKWAYASVVRFLQFQKDRCDRKEIPAQPYGAITRLSNYSWKLMIFFYLGQR